MLGGLPVYGDLWPSGPDLELWNEIFLGGFAERLIYHSLKRAAANREEA